MKSLHRFSRQRPSTKERCGAWWNAIRDVGRKVSIDASSYLLELEERARALLREAEAILKTRQNKIERARRPLKREAQELEKKAEDIGEKAGDEPELRPTVPFWLAWMVAALGAVVEISVTFPTITHLHLGPAGLALAFAIALTAVFVLAGHVIGLLRRVVHSRKTASLIVVCAAIAFAVPLAIVFAQLRLASVSRFQDVQSALGADPPGQIVTATHPPSPWILYILLTLSIVSIVALFRFEAEYGGSRYGLAAIERKLGHLRHEIDQLDAEFDGLKDLYETVSGAIQSRFDRLGLIYRKHHMRAWARKFSDEGGTT